MTETFAARYFDARSAHPLHGRIGPCDTGLEFRPSVGSPVRIAVSEIGPLHVVRDEVHLELRSVDPGQPAPKLIVEGSAFEELVEDLRVAWGGRGAAVASRSRRLSLKAWIALALIVVPCAYLLFVWGAERAHVLVSMEAECTLADFVFEQMSGRWEEVDAPHLQEQLETMAAALAAPDSPYELRISLLASKAPNAFALPGGRIVIFSGLFRLCETPDAVAGVLAHEIAHVEERHGLRHLFRTLGTLYFASAFIGGGLEQLESLETVAELSGAFLVLRHSRSAEREADELAAAKLHRNDASLIGMIGFFEALRDRYGMGEMEERLAWVSTHPLTADRIAWLEQARLAETSPARTWLDAAAWQEALEELGDEARFETDVGSEGDAR